MKSLTAEELLNAWEQGLNKSLLQKALVLLVAAYPDMHPNALLELSIGQRDLRLLQLRERLFGQQLLNTAVCPQCEQRIEWENRVADFAPQSAQKNTSKTEHKLDKDDYTLRFRLPDSIDIATVLNNEHDENSAVKAEQQLLSRCLLKAEHSGTACDISQLPDSVIQALLQQFEELDPNADIRIRLNCPACAHSWDALFDIASFLCAEVNDWAEQMLRTVHKLAAGYGWSEREILRLSPVRRQLYMGMLET